MAAILGSVVDFLHALLMIAWVLGLPLLFWHHWPRATRWYATYAVGFIVLSQGSHLLTGECFLTTLAGALWARGGLPAGSAPDEWFTVRFARAVFHMTPSHHAISRASEALILVTAAGLLVWLHRQRRAQLRTSSAAPSSEARERPPATRAHPWRAPAPGPSR